MDIKETTKALEELYKARNQRIIQLDKLGVPQAEIARQLKVSRQRVNQIINRELKKE
jgi:predicted XRE-type DNA-binding protein